MLDCWTGIDFLKVLQDIRESAPDFITDFLTCISSIFFYMVVPLILFTVMYWFYDKKKGEFCMMNIISAYMLTNFFKFIIKQPRPYMLDPEIKPVSMESSYSTPSAHASIAVGGYGSMILVIKNNLLKIVLLIFIILIIFSRMYLGVHTPLDMILGLLVAFAVIIANYYLLKKSWESDRNYYIIGVGYVIFFAITTTATIMMMDTDFKSMAFGSGLLMGLLISRLIEHRYVGFEAIETSLSNKIVLGLIGLLVMALLIGIPFAIGIPIVMFVGGFLALLWVCVAYPYLMMNKTSFLSKFV